MNYLELSDEAKERAFESFKNRELYDNHWAHCVFEDWVERLEAIGITTSTDQMYYSGFHSQGDGACFTGSINLREFLEAHPDLKKEHAKLYMATIPFDHRGAACEYYDLELTRHGSTNYSHHNTVQLGTWDLNILPEYDTEDGEDYVRLIIDAEADIERQCREYMKEIYRELENAYEYEFSMDNFFEGVEYMDFEEDGSLS